MENIKAKRIYSFIFDVIISNSIGLLIFSILNIDEKINTGIFEILNSKINYGFSLQIVVFFLYNIAFDFLNKGISFGKLIFSIKVVSIENSEETKLNILILRTILKVLSTILLPFSIIIYIYNGFTIHEKFSKTKTVLNQNK